MGVGAGRRGTRRGGGSGGARDGNIDIRILDVGGGGGGRSG